MKVCDYITFGGTVVCSHGHYQDFCTMGTARKFANEHACIFKLFKNIFMDHSRAVWVHVPPVISEDMSMQKCLTGFYN
jgi:hypothetical protein